MRAIVHIVGSGCVAALATTTQLARPTWRCKALALARTPSCPQGRNLVTDRLRAPDALKVATFSTTSEKETTMVEVKTHRDHPASMAERIAKRERNSGDTAHADVVRKSNAQGSNYHNIHKSRV